MCTTLLYSGVEYLSIYLFKNNPTGLHKVDFMTGYRRLITNLIISKGGVRKITREQGYLLKKPWGLH